jgi:hypothetical protein
MQAGYPVSITCRLAQRCANLYNRFLPYIALITTSALGAYYASFSAPCQAIICRGGAWIYGIPQLVLKNILLNYLLLRTLLFDV